MKSELENRQSTTSPSQTLSHESLEATLALTKPEGGDRHHHSFHGTRAGRNSVFMCALAIFAALNMVLSFWSPVEFDKFKFPYQGWAWWTFANLRNNSDVYNVALLGSSLMVSAVNNSDAMHTKKNLNLAIYHKAVFFDELLTKEFGGAFNTYNLSGPGQMPSDAYMTLTTMLKTHRRPDVVIYGVAPRDFIDSSMASPVDTEPYKFLHRLVNLDDSVNKLFKSPWDKLNWIIERDVYLSGNALDISMIMHENWQKTLNGIFQPPVGKRMFTYWDRLKLLPQYKPGEIHPLAVVVQPQDPNKEPTFVDNTPEYLERYKNPDDDIYRIQWHFLVKLVELCKRERIELVVINMPITKDNIRVLGASRYLSYINALRGLAQEHDVLAFELNDFKLYNRRDYADGVHLNAFGGNKLFNQLIGILGATYTTRLALEHSGRELELRKKIAEKTAPDNFPTDIQL